MKKLLLSLIPGLAVAILFAACGSNNNGSSTPAVAAVTACTPGTGYSTQYGSCLPQGNCPVNYGSYSGQCVPVTLTTGAYGYGGSTYGSQCTAGYVYTMQGCLTQGGCPANTGYFNGQCIQAMATSGYPTGYPQSGYPTGYPQSGYSYGGGGYYPTPYSQGLYGYVYYH